MDHDFRFFQQSPEESVLEGLCVKKIDLSDYCERDIRHEDLGNLFSQADLNHAQTFNCNCLNQLHQTDEEHRETLPPSCHFVQRELHEENALEDLFNRLNVNYESGDESRYKNDGDHIPL